MTLFDARLARPTPANAILRERIARIANVPVRPVGVPQATTVESIQYLRAVACWSVVVFHIFASLNSELGWSNPFAFGAIGVDVFFVISGYIMAMIVARDAAFQPLTFLMKRAARVAPLYWMMTLGIFAVSLVLPHLMNNPDLGWSKLLFSMLFMPDPITGTTVPAMSVGWTLNFEVFFYAMVAVTVGLSGDRGLMVTVGALVLAVIAGVLFEGGTVFDFFTQPIILEFAFGILIWKYGSIATEHRWFAPIWLVAMPLAIMALVVSGAYDDTWRFAIWGIPAAFFFLGARTLFTARLPWLNRLGDWSFSTYLLHVYVIQLFVKIAAAKLAGSPLLIAAAIGAVITAVIVGSAMLHLLFEKPVTAWLNGCIAKLMPRRRETFQPA